MLGTHQVHQAAQAQPAPPQRVQSSEAPMPPPVPKKTVMGPPPPLSKKPRSINPEQVESHEEPRQSSSQQLRQTFEMPPPLRKKAEATHPETHADGLPALSGPNDASPSSGTPLVALVDYGDEDD